MMKTLQKFTSVHASRHNLFNQERDLISQEELQGDAQPHWLSGRTVAEQPQLGFG